MSRHFVAPLVSLALLAVSPTASAADAARGGSLAGSWCSSCHIIDTGTAQKVADRAPTFRSIANDSEKTDAYLKRFMANPHYPMPNLDLGRRDIDDLVAYIGTLRTKTL